MSTKILVHDTIVIQYIDVTICYYQIFLDMQHKNENYVDGILIILSHCTNMLLPVVMVKDKQCGEQGVVGDQ